MRPFPVASFLTIVRQFQSVVSFPLHPGGTNNPLSGEEKARAYADCQRWAERLEGYGLPCSADHLKRIGRKLENDAPRKEVWALIPDIINRLEDECNRLVVMVMDSQHIKYFSNAQYFDSDDKNIPQVSVQFPSAGEDIAEAGKCLACGRSTACVMHLSRIVEVGLVALAGVLGSGPQNNWGRYLSEIDKELIRRIQQSGARTPDEQFYSEAQIIIDAIRRAWRNPTMHIDKTYTMERAEEILITVRSFMRHLATRLHE